MKRSTTFTVDPTDGPFVLAFDVEALGDPSEYFPIQLGAVVMNSKYKVLDQFTYSEYRHATDLGDDISDYDVYFPRENRCWSEFWSKEENQKILHKIRDETDLTKEIETSRSEMIHGFVDFVKKWTERCSSANCTLIKIVDNKSYDVAKVNALIEVYCDEKARILPWDFYTEKYDRVAETRDIQLGILLGYGFRIDQLQLPKGSKLFTIMETIWDIQIPECVPAHDHTAINDAHRIAFEAQLCLAIGRKQIPLKAVSLEVI